MIRVLLDEDLPIRLRNHFPEGIEVETVEYRGWKGLENGALLTAAAKDFDALVTRMTTSPLSRTSQITTLPWLFCGLVVSGWRIYWR
jgi:hypothetical protein